MRWIGLAGIVVLFGIAYLFSANRRAIRWYTVLWGFALQVLFAFLVLYWEAGKNGLERFSLAITGAISYADQGGSFVFGWLTGRMEKIGEVTGQPIGGYIFAFKVLPIIIFIASFFTILYYLGIMQKVVQGMAWVMQRLMRVSGAESLAVAANVFIGQTEAPILIAPYIPTMTRSELLTMMTGGMAHVSGAVLLAYVAMGIPAQYLITASVMAAPGAIMMAKILMPETEVPVTMGEVKLKVEKTQANVIDAAASGASQGMMLVINIVAMLIAFIALIALLNGFFGWVGGLFGYPKFSLQTVFGWVLWPLAVVMGVPVKDAGTVADLIGNKTVINEFFAYAKMSTVQSGMSEKARIIASFALCGFANFSSIGIQIGGIGGLAPNRKSDIARLGFRALLGGSLASFMTATIAGLLAG
jgi:concentrative nucleoside transporter, CNT family